ncbi:MAG: invasion associated locus B family protein [Roseiarcus sp.]
MSRMRFGQRVALASVVLICGVASLAAQTPTPVPKPAAPPPVGAEPQSTTATYGDWVLRCQRTQQAEQAKRVCEIVQTLEVKGQGVVAQIAFGRLSAADPLRMTVVLPPNITLPRPVRVVINEKDVDPAQLEWKRCLPGGCVAETEIRDTILRAWRVQSGSGQIRYAVGSGQELAVAFSFRGLDVALDNLAKAGAAQ